MVKPTWVGRDIDSWGIDHGTWSVLLHAFPDASIPVVQLSLNAFKDLRLPPGARPQARRRSATTASSSSAAATSCTTCGPSTSPSPTPDTTGRTRFDDGAREILLSSPTEVAVARRPSRLPEAVPTPDHYLPLLYIAGLAGEEPLSLLVDGHAAGSISMAAYTLGVKFDTTATAGAGPAASLPDGFPALDSNL